MNWLRRMIRKWLGIQALADEVYYIFRDLESSQRRIEQLTLERNQWRQCYEQLLKTYTDNLLLSPPMPIIVKDPQALTP